MLGLISDASAQAHGTPEEHEQTSYHEVQGFGFGPRHPDRVSLVPIWLLVQNLELQTDDGGFRRKTVKGQMLYTEFGTGSVE